MLNVYEFTKVVKDLEDNAKKLFDKDSFKWFVKEWDGLGMHLSSFKQDKYNYRMFHWIPDCVNTYYRYVIDVKPRKERNIELEEFLNVSGYKYFLIQYNDLKTLTKVAKEIMELRKTKDNV